MNKCHTAAKNWSDTIVYNNEMIEKYIESAIKVPYHRVYTLMIIKTHLTS